MLSANQAYLASSSRLPTKQQVQNTQVIGLALF